VNELPEQVPFPDPEFVDNPEPRCPCILLLDTSGSMDEIKVVSTGLSPVQKILNNDTLTRRVKPIDELNAGLMAFRTALLTDGLAIKRVELSLMTFGPVRRLTEFQSPDIFSPPTLGAAGDTPMGTAIEKAIEILNDRKASYRQNGISYYRPWIFMISDGEPTDSWERAAELVRKGEDAKAFAFFAVGVEGANFELLRKISVRQPLKLSGLRFRDMFMWLSSSLAYISRSSPGDDIELKNPASPDGWATL
jgi:uncharacterized protein YegL